ncbi:MAG: hypothetical protein ACQETH_04875 [Candidatus Rifleibacteriota bacterium]
MGLLKKRKKLPFLLATGVFLLLSASFMAVYFWSEKGPGRGVASALEAPVMPPGLNSPEIVAPPTTPGVSPKEEQESQVIEKPVKEPEARAVKADLKKAEKQEDKKVIAQKVKDDTVEKASSQEIGLQEPDEMLRDYSENKVVATAAPVEDVAPDAMEVEEGRVEESQVKEPVVDKEDEAAREIVKPAKSETKQKKASDKPVKVKKSQSPEEELPKAPEADIKQKSVEKKKPARAAKAPSTKRRKVQSKKTTTEIPTEVPPEWNWFKAPLKVDRVKGKVSISSGLDAIESIRPVHKEHGKDSKERAVEKIKEVATKTEVKEKKPFARALARMAKLKAKRSSSNAKSRLQQLKAAEKPLEKVSPALKRINDLLQKLKVQSNAMQMTQRLFERHASSANSSLDSAEAISPDNDSSRGALSSCHKANATTGVADDASKSSVSGGLSMRMREFVRSGTWLNSRS